MSGYRKSWRRRSNVDTRNEAKAKKRKETLAPFSLGCEMVLYRTKDGLTSMRLRLCLTHSYTLAIISMQTQSQLPKYPSGACTVILPRHHPLYQELIPPEIRQASTAKLYVALSRLGETAAQLGNGRSWGAGLSVLNGMRSSAFLDGRWLPALCLFVAPLLNSGRRHKLLLGLFFHFFFVLTNHSSGSCTCDCITSAYIRAEIE
jgi:hypothetical protein